MNECSVLSKFLFPWKISRDISPEDTQKSYARRSLRTTKRRIQNFCTRNTETPNFFPFGSTKEELGEVSYTSGMKNTKISLLPVTEKRTS